MTRTILLAVALILHGNSCFAENLALGRPYTFSHPPNYGGCTDPGDGVRNGSVWSRKGTAGWVSGAQSKSIEIDLGQICSVEGLTFASGADTDARHRDGLVCSSDEASVTDVERRDQIVQLMNWTNQRWEEFMSEAKSFCDWTIRAG